MLEQEKNCLSYKLEKLITKVDGMEIRINRTIKNVYVNYYFYSQYKSWNEAESFCQGINGHLVSINSKDENTFLQQEMKKRGFKHLYIGLYNNNTEHQGQWIDGSKVQYTNWYSGEPSGNGECYAVMMSDGKWNDVASNHIYQFACKLTYIIKSFS